MAAPHNLAGALRIALYLALCAAPFGITLPGMPPGRDLHSELAAAPCSRRSSSVLSGGCKHGRCEASEGRPGLPFDEIVD